MSEITSRQFLNMAGACSAFMYGLSLCLFLIDYLNYNSLINRYQISICFVVDSVIKIFSQDRFAVEVLFQSGSVLSWIEVGVYQNLTAAQEFIHECYPRNGTDACYVSSSDIKLYLSDSYALLTACLVFFILGSICILIYIGLKLLSVFMRRGYRNLDETSTHELDFTSNGSANPPPIDFVAAMRSFDDAQRYMWKYKSVIQFADFDKLRQLQMTAIMGNDKDKVAFQACVKTILERVDGSSGRTV